ncbi:Small auxin-up RNA [Dillenia turbinata]|uniref:Small auxin-up RNA n=1 Tax=Dillenia turbinata TaxID=194707 RepID=A0AAN8VVZ2_9MAGN
MASCSFKMKMLGFKQLMQRCKSMTTRRPSDSECGTTRRVPLGHLAVYVGEERCRFVIPTRFLNLPLFVSLLDKAEEEFGFQSGGGLVLPCEVNFFKLLLKFLEMDEECFGGLRLDEVLRMFSEAGFDSCRESSLDNIYIINARCPTRTKTRFREHLQGRIQTQPTKALFIPLKKFQQKFEEVNLAGLQLCLGGRRRWAGSRTDSVLLKNPEGTRWVIPHSESERCLVVMLSALHLLLESEHRHLEGAAGGGH